MKALGTINSSLLGQTENMAALEAAQGYGFINWWGFSPALDLLDDVQGSTNPEAELDRLLPELSLSDSDKAPLKILIAGAGDCRHVVLTMSRLKRKLKGNSRPIHFYVIEHTVEQLARHMLMLAIIHEPNDVMPLQVSICSQS